MISFEDHGIATVLSRYSLTVPVYQRPYAWEESHVRDFFADIERAIEDASDDEYFLGAMCGIRADGGRLDVADGQQRLATTVILISALRNALLEYSDQGSYVTHLETKYLKTYDPDLGAERPKLTLNTSDNSAYMRSILSRPNSPEYAAFSDAATGSNLLLSQAAAIAKRQVAKIVDTPHVRDRVNRIRKWEKYLESSAKIILAIVPDAAKAFTIFETLNDRGLKLSQVHLLKNWLYGLAQSGGRMAEAQQRWDAMYGTLESIGDDDLFIDYVRQMWISYYGHVKQEKLFEAIKERFVYPNDAIEFANMLADNVGTFTALLNPSHTLWSDASSRSAMSILNDSLRIDRIRPLLLSIAVKFHQAEQVKAFRLCVTWAVRYMVVGGIGSGTVEEFYAEAAMQVRNGQIPTAESLAAIMKSKAPDDESFRQAFERASVSRPPIARYYLRAMESTLRKTADASLTFDEHPEQFDLEHVLPQKPSTEWPLPDEDLKRLYKRIGNLCLIEKKINSNLKSAGPARKIAAFSASTKLLTQRISKELDWTESQIETRQKDLATLAVRTWRFTG